MPKKKTNKIVPGNGPDKGGNAWSGAKQMAKSAGSKVKKQGNKKGKKKQKKDEKPKKKEVTAEDLAAIRIQAIARQGAAKATMSVLKERKRAYAEEMEQLAKNAYMAQLDYARKQEAKEMKREREVRQQREVREQLKRDLLEAAFDGEIDDVRKILCDAKYACKPKIMTDVTSSKGDTSLSEASAGGDVATVELLLKLGADPNIQGEHKRTPLYRAAFAKHVAVCQTLLKAGGDPRIADKGGETPEKLVHHHEELKELFAEWDCAETDKLMLAFNRRREQQLEEEEQEHRKHLGDLDSQLREAKNVLKDLQTRLAEAYTQKEARVYEYDTNYHRGEAVAKELEAYIKAAEVTVDGLHDKVADAGQSVSELRMQIQEAMNDGGGISAYVDQIPGLKVSVEMLEDVLVKDVGNKIKDDGRPVILVDVSKRAGVFLRYMDSNYLNTCSRRDMQPETLRRAVLGAIRFGKPLVVDIVDLPLDLERLEAQFDAAAPQLGSTGGGDGGDGGGGGPGLFQLIQSGGILRDQAYLRLVDLEVDDKEAYHEARFERHRVERFKLILLSYTRDHARSVWERFYPVEVDVSGAAHGQCLS